MAYDELDLSDNFCTFVLRKINMLLSELHFVMPVCTKSFVGRGFTPDTTELTALNQTPSWVYFKGPYF